MLLHGQYDAIESKAATECCEWHKENLKEVSDTFAVNRVSPFSNVEVSERKVVVHHRM